MVLEETKLPWLLTGQVKGKRPAPAGEENTHAFEHRRKLEQPALTDLREIMKQLCCRALRLKPKLEMGRMAHDPL